MSIMIIFSISIKAYTDKNNTNVKYYYDILHEWNYVLGLEVVW